MNQPTLWPSDAHRASECAVSQTHDRTLVKHLIRSWHSTLPNPPAAYKIAFIVRAPNGAPIGVATWGRPVARQEDQVHTLELTRLALTNTAPYNLASWSMARMRETIRAELPEITRLISYQDADHHHGTIYKADNWTVVYDRVKPNEGPWSNRPGRIPGTQRIHKVKWERIP